MNRKYENSRVVTFKEDYLTKKGNVIYKANSTHAIHKDVVKKLEAEGVKMKVDKVDYSSIEAKKAKEHLEAKRAA